MFERQGGALDRDQGQDCGDNSALHLDGSRRRRHCGARLEHFSGCFRWVQGGAQFKLKEKQVSRRRS
jgi:hypothetical protein